MPNVGGTSVRDPSEMNFAELVLAGWQDGSHLGGHIEAWHEGDSPLPLHKYLGFTRAEWGLITADRSSLRIVLTAKDQQIPLEDLLAFDMVLAARTSGVDVAELRAWMERHHITP